MSKEVEVNTGDDGIEERPSRPDPIIGTYLGPPILGPPSADSAKPRTILHSGRYKPTRKVGQGGMGAVYEGEDLLLGGRPVAIKVLTPPSDIEDEDLVALLERFRREVMLLAEATHPNVVTVYDVSTSTDKTPFIIMQLLKGCDLDTTLERIGKGAEKDFESMCRQMGGILHALAACHRRGFIHRDIKPGNLYKTEDGVQEEMKLLDLGIARFFGPRSEGVKGITGTGKLFGTMGYMAPEQISGAEPGPQADQFAVGVVVYEWLVGYGQRPYDTLPDAPNTFVRMVAMTQSHGHGVEPWLDNLPKWLPPGFREMLGRSLDPDPVKRFDSTDEFRDLMCGFGGITPQSPTRSGANTGNSDITNPVTPKLATETFSPHTGDRRPVRSDRKGHALLAGIGGMIGFVMVLFFSLRPSHPPQHVLSRVPRVVEPRRLPLAEVPDAGVLPPVETRVPQRVDPPVVAEPPQQPTRRRNRPSRASQEERESLATIRAAQRVMSSTCCRAVPGGPLRGITYNGHRVSCPPAPNSREWRQLQCGDRH